MSIPAVISWVKKLASKGQTALAFSLGWAAATLEPVLPEACVVMYSIQQGKHFHFRHYHSDTRLFPAKCGLGSHVLCNTTTPKLLLPQLFERAGPQHVDMQL